MSASHFFISHVGDDVLTIVGDDARHAVKVLRIKPDERITIGDGLGTIADAVVTAAGQTLTAEVTGRRFIDAGVPHLTVYQALPKHPKLDEIVKSLTQLGVERVVPVAAKRSIARWDAAKAKASLKRLRLIAREAAMQSRRAWLPIIDEPIPLAQALINGESIVLHEEGGSRLQDVLPATPPPELAVVIGPEGGFDASEIEAAGRAGCPVASMGPTVVRTNLAGVVAATVVLARYGRLG